MMGTVAQIAGRNSAVRTKTCARGLILPGQGPRMRYLGGVQSLSEEEVWARRAAAEAEYDRVEVQAKATRDRLITEAGEEFERVTVSARTERDRIIAQAEAAYERVLAPVDAAYERRYAEAWDEYKRVHTQARAALARVRAAYTLPGTGE